MQSSSTHRIEVADFRLEVPLVYVDTAIPAGMTIAEYRASRPRPARRGLRRYLCSKKSC